jgi:hypothetical protein
MLSVKDEAGLAEAPASLAVKSTVHPATPLPKRSTTRATTESVSGAPTVPCWSAPDTMTRESAAATVPVARNDTEAMFVASAAVPCCAPAAPPSTQRDDARPSAPTVADALTMAPPPVVTPKPTTELTTLPPVPPGTGRPRLSRISTRSGSASVSPTTPDCTSPEILAIWVATCSTTTATWPVSAPDVAVTVVEPFVSPVTVTVVPVVALRLATVASATPHVTVCPVIVAPFWSFTVAVTVAMSPSDARLIAATLSESVVGTGTGGVVVLLHAEAMAPTIARPAMRRTDGMDGSLEGLLRVR